MEILKRAAAVGQQLNPQYQAPAAAQGNLKFLQDTAEAAKDALDRGDFVGLAKQVDQFAKSSASAEGVSRFRRGYDRAGRKRSQGAGGHREGEPGLGQLAGSAASGAGRARDPSLASRTLPKELDRVREDIQRGLDAIARTVAEKKAVVDREFAETAAAISSSAPCRAPTSRSSTKSKRRRRNSIRLDGCPDR